MQALKWSISTFKSGLLRSSLGSSKAAKSHAYVQLFPGDLTYCCKTSFKPKPSELAQVGPVGLSAESTDLTNLISQNLMIWQIRVTDTDHWMHLGSLGQVRAARSGADFAAVLLLKLGHKEGRARLLYTDPCSQTHCRCEDLHCTQLCLSNWRFHLFCLPYSLFLLTVILRKLISLLSHTSTSTLLSPSCPDCK